MVLRQKDATRCNLHRMSLLRWFKWWQQEVPKNGRHGTPAALMGRFYVRLGLGDGVTADVSAAVSRSMRIASTALRTPVSSKSVQAARIHEPRSGHPSK